LPTIKALVLDYTAKLPLVLGLSWKVNVINGYFMHATQSIGISLMVRLNQFNAQHLALNSDYHATDSITGWMLA
jgi:hypothetical protein